MTALNNIFPSLAVNLVNGDLYAVWSDGHGIWNVYDSQISGGSVTVSKVSNTANRIGAVCTEGTGCVGGLNRELLDLFEVAEDPASGKAAIIYTDTTLDTWTSPVTGMHQLPEIVLAYEQ